MLRSASKRAADDPHAPSVPPLKRRSVDIDPKLRAEWRSAEQGQQLLLQQQRQASTSPSSSAQHSAAVDVCGLTADDWCGQGTGKKTSQCPPKSATTTGLSWGRGRARFNLNSHSNISRHLNIAGEKNLFLPHSKISFLPTSASPVFPSPPPPPSRTGGKLTRMPFDLLAPNFPLQTRLSLFLPGPAPTSSTPSSPPTLTTSPRSSSGLARHLRAPRPPPSRPKSRRPRRRIGQPASAAA